MKHEKGFTLIELMIVVTIIGILAAIAIPSYSVYVNTAHVAEPISYGGHLKSSVTEYYRENLSFPKDNMHAQLPPADKLISNKIEGVDIIDGAVHIKLGNKLPEMLKGKYLTFRPAVVIDSPLSPIDWLCGYDEPVSGMLAIGENKTNIDDAFLPSECRSKP